jgi:hypothetical protein
VYKKIPKQRYDKTLAMLQRLVPAPARILDLGVSNPFSEIMTAHGYEVQNTQGQDLDFYPQIEVNPEVDLVTSFEVFEHLVSPFTVLQQLPANKLFATVPLRLWFASAYRSHTDLWDRHYHEFEDWQFDWLLEKSGWEIKERCYWKNPSNAIGIRPFLRKITPRYYAVYAERKSS